MTDEERVLRDFNLALNDLVAVSIEDEHVIGERGSVTITRKSTRIIIFQGGILEEHVKLSLDLRTPFLEAWALRILSDGGKWRLDKSPASGSGVYVYVVRYPAKEG